MNKKTTLPYSLPVAGPTIVFILVILALVLVPQKNLLIKPADFLSSKLRIDSLEDSQLAGNIRLLSTSFDPDSKLNFDGGKRYDLFWDEYEIFGVKAFAPRLPDALLSKLEKKSELTENEFEQLLDLSLRYHSTQDAIAHLGNHLTRFPDDSGIREIAARFFADRLMPQKAIDVQIQRFALILKEIKKEDEIANKEKLTVRAKDVISNIDILRKAYLLSGETDLMLKKLIDSCPEKSDIFFDYLNRLIEKKKYQAAWEFLVTREKVYKKDIKEILRTKSKILEGQGLFEKAIQLYDVHPDLIDSPNDLFSDFLSLLARTHRTETWRKELLDRSKDQIDIQALKRLSAYYFRNGQEQLFYEQVELAEKHARDKGINESELRELAALCMEEGSQTLINKAGSFRWNLYLLSKEGASREKSLIELVKALAESNQAPPFPVGSALPGAPVAAFLDRYPGLSGGVLSLDLNLRGTKERFSAAVNAGQKYENMRIALYLIEPLVKDGSTDEIASEAILTAANIYKELGLDQRFLEVVQDYFKRFPKGDSIATLLWDLAYYYQKKEEFKNELSQYMKLLDLEKEKKDQKELVRIRKRIVNRMVSKKQFAQVIPFYWSQIEKERDDEKLLMEFIDFCKRHSIFKDTVQAYEIAAERFDTRKYSDRLARYLISWKKRNAFENLTESLSSVLHEDDFQQYLNRHVYYGSWNSSESLFFERMYLTALQRFPHNFNFFDKLHTFYKGFEKKHPEALQKKTALLIKYFAVYSKASKNICETLAKQGKLDSAVPQLLKKRNLNPVEMRLLAEGLGYLSMFEAQYFVTKQLERAYQERDLTLNLASLERSLDSSFYIEDPSLTETAAKRYSNLAGKYPAAFTYATLAGEVFVEAGKQKSAARAWEKILLKEPGEEKTYLELATLYWDYYLYELGLSVIEQGRKTTDNPMMLAKEAAYLYESMKRQDLAIEQYVRVICKNQNVDWEVAERLRRLGEKKNVQAMIDKAFDRYLKRPETNYTDILNYGMYLGYYDIIDKKTALFKKYMNTFSNDEFLTAISDYFSGQGYQKFAQTALERLAEATGRTTDVLLRLLAFYEMNDKVGEISDLCDELDQKNGPGSLRHEAILIRTSRARWDQKLYLASLNGYRQWANLGSGTEKDQRLYDYALKCLEGGEPESGVNILLELAQKYPERAKYYREIAEYYGDAGEYKKLVSLYKEAIKKTNDASISWAEKQIRVKAHRRSLAEALFQLEKYTEALDQYIEIINATVNDRALTDEVFRFAQTNNLLERLVSYYEKLSEKSHKDYRWQLVLGDFYAKRGDPKKAAIQYEKAIHNEPQRLYLYGIWAIALQKANDVEGALKVLERRYELSGTADDLRRIAEYAFSAGKREKAKTILLKLVEDPKTPSWRLFEVVDILDKNRERILAYDLAVSALERFKTNPVKMDIRKQQLEIISIITAKRFGFLKGYEMLWNLMEWLEDQSASKSGLVKNRLKSHARIVENTLTSSYAKYVHDSCPPDEFETLQNSLIFEIAKRINVSNTSSSGTNAVKKVAGFYLQFAKNARMNRLQLATLKAKADAFQIYVNDKKRLNLTKEAVNQYFEELRWKGDPKIIIGELKRLHYPDYNRAEFAKRKARYSFLSGDVDTELASLEQMYKLGRRKSFAKMDDYHVRYLDILWETNQNDFLSFVTTTKMPGFLVGYCAWKNLPEHAINALNLHWKNPESSWTKRRKIQVYEYVDNESKAIKLYESILGYPRIIQSQEENLIDGTLELKGNRWFEWANLFGKLLLSINDPEADLVLSALPEKSPKSGASYLEVARTYSESKKYDQAFKMIDLAESLQGETSPVIKSKAAVFLKKGEKGNAAKEYEKLIIKTYANIHSYRNYYYLMEKAGMGRLAIDKYQKYLFENFNTLSHYDQAEEAIFITDKLGKSARAIQFLRDVVQKSPQMLYLIERIKNESFLPSSELGWFLEAGTNKVLQSKKTSLSSKLRWIKLSIDYAMKHSDMALGTKMIQAARDLDTFMGAKGEYDLKDAELEMRCIDGSPGNAKLFQMASECKTRYDFDDLINIAKKVRRDEEVKQLRHIQLKTALNQNNINNNERIELADLEYENGFPQKAVPLLEYVASNVIENSKTLALIAKIYLRAGYAKEALPHLQRAVAQSPTDGGLKTLEGITLACIGKVEDGSKLVAESLENGSVSRSGFLPLIKESKNILEKNNRIDEFSDELFNINKTGAQLFNAYLLFETKKSKKSLEELHKLSAPTRYESFRLHLLAKAYHETENYEKELDSLNQAIALVPHEKKLVADRFFVLMKLGRPAHALDSIEKWLPTHRYPLLEPTSFTGSVGLANSLPGKVGLSDNQAERMLESTADAFWALNRPSQAKIYLQALENRLEDKPGKNRITKRIEKINALVETLSKKLKPWPLITNEK